MTLDVHVEALLDDSENLVAPLARLHDCKEVLDLIDGEVGDLLKYFAKEIFVLFAGFDRLRLWSFRASQGRDEFLGV